MHPNALLELAAELLRALLKFDAPADGVVAAFFRKHRALGTRERRTLTETAYAVLRQRLLFQHLARSDVDSSASGGALERRLAMLAWQGSESFLHGALTPGEQQWLAEAGRIDRQTLPDKLRHNLPDWLAGQLQARLGDEFWPLVQALDGPAPLDLRVNVLKARREDVQRTLAESGVASEPTPFSPWGLRVNGKPLLTRHPGYLAGHFEVQDEGSQLLALLTDPKRGEMVVDFCAGAGGKTLALGACMRNTGRLYAFDTSGHRLDALKPRLARSGLSNVHPAQIAHERDERIKRLAGKIDRVLIDAPCSGLGTLRPWSMPPAACWRPRTKRWHRPSRPPTRRTSSRCRYCGCCRRCAWSSRSDSSKGHSCACGRIGTIATASLPPSGSGADKAPQSASFDGNVPSSR